MKPFDCFGKAGMMKKEELVNLLEKKEVDCDCNLNKEELGRQIIDYFYSECKYEYFQDYCDVVSVLFRLTKFIKFEDLKYLDECDDYEKKFLDSVINGLKYAGEKGEKGYASEGLATVRRYASCLSEQYIEEILRYSDQFKEGVFGSQLRTKVIKTIVESSILTKSKKNDMKFRFFDSYILCRIFMRRLSAYIQKAYGNYRYIDIDELNPTPRQKALFYRALEYNSERLYVKVDRIGLNKMYLTLTPDFEPDSMKDYVLDVEFVLEKNGEIKVKLIAEDKVKEKDLIQFNFDPDRWDTNLYDDCFDINKFLSAELGSTYREEFELIYFYAEGIYGYLKREMYFRNDISVVHDDKKVFIEENELTKRPSDFYGRYINNICAVIGKNGSGKSSVFGMLANNPIFSGEDKEAYKAEWGDYLIIYKLGNNYYYSKSIEKQIDVRINGIEVFENNDIVNVNICILSNTFDAHAVKELHDDIVDPDNTDVGKLSGLIDFTTTNMLKYGFEVYKKMEEQRINNLKDFLNKKEGKKDFGLKEYENLKCLSSGEYARWSLFSRILSIFYCGANNTILHEVQQKDNYFLLFDEAELYMHPEWQRKLINDIIKFIEYINEDQTFFSNMTIVFSSNSPFLMSDLPGENIILFEQKQRIKTFGQNIYDILRGDFFMPTEPMGAFAYEKIRQAFKEVDDMNANEKEQAKYIADILGDELFVTMLRRRLNV